MTEIDDILENFDFLDDWEDRYRYVIELGKELEPFPEECRTDEYKVRGCVSQVWLVSDCRKDDSGTPRLYYKGDSDAHIVRGLVAILLALVSGRTAAEINELDIEGVFNRIGLRDHLTPQRSNGLTSMVARIKADAQGAVAAA